MIFKGAMIGKVKIHWDGHTLTLDNLLIRLFEFALSILFYQY